jgi:Domain of unknown function (DUF4279)
MWRFRNTLKEDRGLEGNLTWLLDSLEPKRSGIRTLAEEHRVDFFCGLSSGDEQGGATLSSITLSRISKFGVPLIMNLSPPLPSDSDEGGAGDPPRINHMANDDAECSRPVALARIQEYSVQLNALLWIAECGR